jgi:hypothetical protein
MTGTNALMRVSLRSARFLLPWLSVLAISTSVAHAMTGGPTVRDRQPDVEFVEVLGGANVAAAVESTTTSLPPYLQPGWYPEPLSLPSVASAGLDRSLASKQPDVEFVEVLGGANVAAAVESTTTSLPPYLQPGWYPEPRSLPSRDSWANH